MIESRPRIGVNMTKQEKKAECERICGESGKRGIHSSAPEMCPILEYMWKNPKRKNDYQGVN
jgi:hypothetical protein